MVLSLTRAPPSDPVSATGRKHLTPIFYLGMKCMPNILLGGQLKALVYILSDNQEPGWELGLKNSDPHAQESAVPMIDTRWGSSAMTYYCISEATGTQADVNGEYRIEISKPLQSGYIQAPK